MLKIVNRFERFARDGEYGAFIATRLASSLNGTALSCDYRSVGLFFGSIPNAPGLRHLVFSESPPRLTLEG